MKLRMAAIAFVVALVLVSSFASIVTAESEENTGPDDTVSENLEDMNNGGDSEANPLGDLPGGGEGGGGTPR